MSGFNELIPQALIQIFDPNELEVSKFHVTTNDELISPFPFITDSC